MSSNDASLNTSHTAADVAFSSAREGEARPPRRENAESSSRSSSRTSRGNKSSTSNTFHGHANGVVQRAQPNGKSKVPRSQSSTPKKSGGFLLDNVISPAQSRGRQKAPGTSERHEQDPQIAVDKRRSIHSHFSGESSHRGSPLSQEVLREDARSDAPLPGRFAQPQAMDPAQLVQMALSLSESRKRHVSGSKIPISVPTTAGGRAFSGLESGYGTIRSRPTSAQHSARLSEGGPRQSTPSSSDGHAKIELANGGFNTSDSGHYEFSPATLSRAEKARRYFELASEHRRLLDHLPPIKTEGSFPRFLNGSAGDGIRHSATADKNQDLGRAYNPLQALRNRRLRNREGRALSAPPDVWHDLDKVKQWVDDVVITSAQPYFSSGGEQIHIPEYVGELDHDHQVRPPTSKGHRRTDTVGSVLTRPESGWNIEPSEMLADTYWIERADNKALLEDRRGHRIRPSQRRSSGEAQHRSGHADYEEGLASDKHSQFSISDDDDKVRHRRRNRLPLAGRIRRRRLPRIARSASATSLSSDEGRLPPELQFGNSSGGDENIGPLERHMRDMIAQDERGELSSPELMSPDYWESPNSRFPVSRISIDKKLRESRHHTAGRHSIEGHKHRRPTSSESRFDPADHGMSSMDEFLSDTPSSPVIPTLVPPMGLDLSLPEQYSSTPDRTARATRIPLFRSRSKDRNQIERTDFAEIPAVSTGTGGQAREQGGKSSLEVPRPGQFTRHRTTESFTNTLRRLNTGSTNPASEVSSKDSGNRFFRGGRISELVRNEGSRLGDRFRTRDRAADVGGQSDISRAASDISDTEDSGKQRNRRSYIGSTDDSEASPRDSFEKDRQTQKYFLSNLPIFSSTSARDKRPVDGTQSSENDPIAIQQKAQREAGRSMRFQRLAPPKINLPEDQRSPDPDSADKSARSSESKRRWGALRLRTPAISRNTSSVSLGNPGSIAPANGHLPVTGLYGTVSNESRRHWSISDQGHPEQVKRITARDVARVKALILSSGIKAQELVYFADTPREAPFPPVVRAARTARKDVPAVPRKDEMVVAARMLSDHITSTTSELNRALTHFRGERAKALSSQLEHLEHRAGDQLTTLVHETSDDADSFIVQLTTKAPQDIKRVEDAVNYMFRQRRRRFRLLRHTGFKMLEWMTLSLLWWVWLVVILIKTARRIFWVIFVFLKWLLWF